MATKSEKRLSQKDAEDLTRARIALDAIYDVLMATNLSAKQLLIIHLREIHTTVWRLEKAGHATFIIRALEAGRMKVDQLPDWFAEFVPKYAPAAPEQSEEKS